MVGREITRKLPRKTRKSSSALKRLQQIKKNKVQGDDGGTVWVEIQQPTWVEATGDGGWKENRTPKRRLEFIAKKSSIKMLSIKEAYVKMKTAKK